MLAWWKEQHIKTWPPHSGAVANLYVYLSKRSIGRLHRVAHAGQTSDRVDRGAKERSWLMAHTERSESLAMSFKGGEPLRASGSDQ